MRAIPSGLSGDLPLERRLRIIRRRRRHLVRRVMGAAIWAAAGLMILWLLVAGFSGAWR
jgi:hypothetical protein